MPDLALTAAGSLASRNPQARLHAAARGFEAQFVTELLKPLEQPMFEEEEPLLGGDGAGKTFRGMLNQAMAEQTAGSLGIAQVIERAMHLRRR